MDKPAMPATRIDAVGRLCKRRHEGGAQVRADLNGGAPAQAQAAWKWQLIWTRRRGSGECQAAMPRDGIRGNRADARAVDRHWEIDRIRAVGRYVIDRDHQLLHDRTVFDHVAERS